ncbi:MAG: purine-nucleoside phosphorylase [Paludibacteraceae bacterium]|nr:purine-nucleoside phosphorylase [Paludibacteraceae bacterium]
MLTKIDAACEFLRGKTSIRPKIAIILGTGLGSFANNIDITETISYSEIPGFKTSTVNGHSGNLLFGHLSGVPVMAMQGRLHFYEGYSMQEITFPERVMSRLGVNLLMVSNAAGALNPEYVPGDIMLIADHINMFPENPLRGKNIDELGPRFLDMGDAYDSALINMAEKIADSHHIKYQKGVYIGTPGPTYETRAEYRHFRIIGGDSVGMSTVPEVIVARHCGMKCFGVSVIANFGYDAPSNGISHEDVQKNTEIAQKGLAVIFEEMVKSVNPLL